MMTSVKSLDVPHPPRAVLAALFIAARLGLHLLYGTLLAVFYPRLSHDQQQTLLRKWSGQLLDILHITRHGVPPVASDRPQGLLVVANHVSWLDIFVLNAVMPMRFIAKDEVRDWPVIGWLCRRSGTLFVKRATRQHLISLNQRVADLLKQQAVIGLFPEGTTTEGGQVGEFYPALFQGAIAAAAPVLPVCVYYHDAQGKHSQLAAYTGETSLLSSIWRILLRHDLHVSLTFSAVLNLPVANRRTLAAAAQAAITQLRCAADEADAQGGSSTLPTPSPRFF